MLQNNLFWFPPTRKSQLPTSSRWEEQTLNIQLHPPSRIHKLVLPHSRRETGTFFPRLSEWYQATCIYQYLLARIRLLLSCLTRRCTAHDRSWLSRLSTCPSIAPVIKRVEIFWATSPTSKIGGRRLMTKSKKSLRSSFANIWVFFCSSLVYLLVWGSHGACGIPIKQTSIICATFYPSTSNNSKLYFANVTGSMEHWSTLGIVSY